MSSCSEPRAEHAQALLAALKRASHAGDKATMVATIHELDAAIEDWYCSWYGAEAYQQLQQQLEKALRP